VARGERLAKAGRLTEAIEAFKTADRIEPRARHACLIALAYIRRELWSQAEVFLAACRDRADPQNPLPDWFDLAERELRERLATSEVAPVVVRVEPASAAIDAQVAISSFAPDERFAPRTIHLPVGTHLITATHAGREVRKEVVVVNRVPREVVLDFTASAPTGASTQALRGEPVPARSRSRSRSRWVPQVITAVGGALVVAGAGYHVFAFKPTRDDLADAADDPDPAAYNRLEDRFDSRRRATLALYGVGAAAVITGLALRMTVYRDRPEDAVRVSAGVVDGGGVVGLEWQR
jgi:hypothetical protein